MYDNNRKSSSCTVPKSDSSSVFAGANENRHELSDELTSFLKSEAYRADQIASYAIMCQKYIYILKDQQYGTPEGR
jgi:hypothetical protein